MSITDVLLLQDYISQCVGVHIVGYATMAYGLIASLSGFLTGKVYLAYLPRYVVATMTSLMTLALLTFLLVWEREPSYVFIFVFISLWGVADGQWNTFAPSKFLANCRYMGSLFKHHNMVHNYMNIIVKFTVGLLHVANMVK